jgi:predicted metal-dependent hydrolase
VDEPRPITIDGVALTLVVERKRVKNLNARLRGSTISLSAPYDATMSEIDAAIPEMARTLLRRARARQVNGEEDALALVRRIATRFPQPPEVHAVAFVTTQHSQWGSYSPSTHTIRLNAVLRSMPRWVLEAVAAHELAHAFHLDHSEAFRTLLQRICPATDRADAFLAGVSWLAGNWERLHPVERTLLHRPGEEPD